MCERDREREREREREKMAMEYTMHSLHFGASIKYIDIV